MYIHYLFSIENMDEMLEQINDKHEEIVSSIGLPSQEQIILICKAEPKSLENLAMMSSRDKLAKILNRPKPIES